MFSIPAYEAWLGNRDMSPAYEFHKSFLKHLQWQCPPERWVLKSSDHVHALATLMKTYPESRIVFLHRDPLKVLQAALQSNDTCEKCIQPKHKSSPVGRLRSPYFI